MRHGAIATGIHDLYVTAVTKFQGSNFEIVSPCISPIRDQALKQPVKVV